MTEPSNVTPLRARLQAAEPPKRGHILPDDCPVKALGVQGDFYFYLDAKAQLRPLRFDKHSRSAVVSLFQGNIDYILSKREWQRRDDDGNIKGIRPEAVADDLMRAAASEGIFSPDGRMRGRGAWCGADGDLVLHLGDALWIKGKITPCGVRGESIYAVLPPRPYPAREPQPGGPGGPAFELHGLLQKWRWRRPGTDDLLLLGWICAAKLGGALTWRPAAWLLGGRGCGKTTLQQLMRDLFVNRQGIVSVSSPTEASLRHALRHDAIAVALEEFEAKADNARSQAVLDLARDASSGAEIIRGDPNGQTAQSFTIRSSLLFSSINAPPMSAANRSRIAFLHLEKLERGSKAPALKAEHLRELGQRLLRRLADQWPQWPVRLEIWREALQKRGYDARQQDQFGTLLAAADLAQHDDAPDSDTIDQVVDALVNGSVEERADEIEDWAGCLQHLTSAVSPAWRGGEQRTVGTLVALAAGEDVIEFVNDKGELEIRSASIDEQIAASNMLATVGLRVLPRPDDDSARLLAIANLHTGLNHLYAGSHWQGGSGDAGVWRQALLHCPGARPSTGTVKFRGVTQRAVLVPLALALGQPAPEPTPSE